MVVFSNGFFNIFITTCILRSKPTGEPKVSFDEEVQYNRADYEFINNYCYAFMVNHHVNRTTGELLPTGPTNLKHMQLFPYVLVGFALLGAWTGVCWEMSAKRRSAQAGYLIDGIDEGLGNLISAMKEIAGSVYYGQVDGEDAIFDGKIKKRTHNLSSQLSNANDTLRRRRRQRIDRLENDAESVKKPNESLDDIEITAFRIDI